MWFPILKQNGRFTKSRLSERLNHVPYISLILINTRHIKTLIKLVSICMEVSLRYFFWELI
jgi:hypothetical protein